MNGIGFNDNRVDENDIVERNFTSFWFKPLFESTWSREFPPSSFLGVANWSRRKYTYSRTLEHTNSKLKSEDRGDIINFNFIWDSFETMNSSNIHFMNGGRTTKIQWINKKHRDILVTRRNRSRVFSILNSIMKRRQVRQRQIIDRMKASPVWIWSILVV